MGRQPALSTRKRFSPYVPSEPAGAELNRPVKHDCPHCTLSWTKKSDFDRHVATHKSAKPFACGVEGCHKSFAQRTALATHSNTHTGKRPHPCRNSGCTSTFGDPSSRTRHEKETHDPSNGYQCSKCDHVSKRREQFRRHYQDCFKEVPTEDQIADARALCKAAYAERIANGAAQEEPIAPPPKRKRRGAIAVVSPSTPPEEYEEEDDTTHRNNRPRYESYLGEVSSEPNVAPSPNFYHDNSHLDEPVIGASTYGDAFEPAYAHLQMANYYAQPPPQYPTRDSSSPGHHFDHSIQLARMDSPRYDVHDLGDQAVGHLNDRTRIPTTDSFSTVHSSPGHTGHYSISTSHMLSSPHLAHSPHVASPTPPLLMPVGTRRAMLFDQTHDAPHMTYPQAGYGAVDPTDRTPRSGLNVSHPQFQSRQYLQQYRHHPYARDRRGGPNGGGRSDAYTASPSEAGLPMVDNSYSSQGDQDSDSMPPLSLAGARAARPMIDPSYEGSVSF